MRILNIEHPSFRAETKGWYYDKLRLQDAEISLFFVQDLKVGKYIARAPDKSIKTAEKFIDARHEDIPKHK